MKKILNYPAALFAAFALMSAMPVSAAETGMVGSYDLGSDARKGVSEVVYDTAAEQEFTVIIPKKIVLGSDKTAEYNITVKGDVAQGSKVKVEPRDDVPDAAGTNFVMTAEKSGGSRNVDVTQNDLYWDYAEIVANGHAGTAKPGNVDGSELTFGIWTGNLTFLINFEDEYGAIDPELIGDITDWEYTLNEKNRTVTLETYTGSDTDITVHAYYEKDGVVYKGKFPDNYVPSFDNYDQITSIVFDEGFDTSNMTDMSCMFQCYENLVSLDLSGFDTSNVAYMNDMFSQCYKLQSLNLSSFDTSNVTNMGGMFDSCSELQSLDVSNFNTSNVTDMGVMFDSCSELQSLDVSNFDTSKVTDMHNMFSGCGGLQSLDVSNFDTSKVTDMHNMFSGCGGLQSLDVSNFNTSKVKGIYHMFSNCSKLQSLDLGVFDTSNATDMRCMFLGCGQLTHISVSSLWVTDQADTSDMFKYCGTDHVTVN